jgi:hypothetical protein
MTTNFTVNGVTYSFPTQSDEGWSSQVNSLIQALTLHTLQKTGGAFTLTATLNFGTGYGVLAKYLSSSANNPASDGVIRLANAEAIKWRNQQNNADKTLTVNSSDKLTYDGTVAATFEGNLTGNVTGNASGSAASFTGNLSGDVTGGQSSTAIAATVVTGKVITGYSSGAGVVAATDSILQAVNKLDGNTTAHVGNTSNPHSVTKAQVGLTNVADVAQMPASYLDTTTTLGTSDTKVPSQNAVKTYADTKVAGPATSADNAIPKFKGTNVKEVEASGVSIDDSNNVTGVAALAASGVVGKSATSGLVIPKGTTAERSGSPSEGETRYNSTTASTEIYVGSAWTDVGGGLITVPIDHTYATALAKGNHYLLDMSGASADVTLTLPAGAAKSVVRVSTRGNTALAHRLILDGNGSETITYSGTAYTDVKLLPANGWVQVMWDTNDSTWHVDDQATFVSGTFAGALTVTGALTPSVGIVGRTDAPPAAGYLGESKSDTYNNIITLPESASYSTGTDCSVSLEKGTWLIMCSPHMINISSSSWSGGTITPYLAIVDGSNAVVSTGVWSTPYAVTTASWPNTLFAVVSPTATTVYRLAGRYVKSGSPADPSVLLYAWNSVESHRMTAVRIA